MNLVEGIYWMPILPKEIAGKLKGLEKANWPKDLTVEYKRLHSDFTQAKAEYRMWIRRDRDSRMRGHAKEIASYILDCLNFDTGRCDPSQQTIADELGISLRTVERTVSKIRESGWFEVTRRGKTTSNFYRFRVSSAKVNALLDTVDGLRTLRKEKRENQKLIPPAKSDPTEVAGHSAGDPPKMRSHEPTEVAGHDPTGMAGKYLNRTCEGEPVNKASSSEVRGVSLYGNTSHSTPEPDLSENPESVKTENPENPYLENSIRPARPDTGTPYTENPYLVASHGLDDHEPFPVPTTETDANLVIDALCDDLPVHGAIRNRMLDMLRNGVLTPNMAERLTRVSRENAA
ncbi:hypothetical protein [Rhizobium sp. L245/93]|uniref:hypothetical protein n=1 Tax=Rhizobium sp. L245/93 TaxID=2819998 RepID=UPI001ADC4615|nr:hypothetical protein [Rhizobium sp. L245/93]MBO9168340.1 hypothetical protein [Rhizobium sp. L245/93]